MNEALYGFLGVLIGSFIPWIKEILTDRTQRSRHARYLAVQVGCVLDEFVDKCVAVVDDDGTAMGRYAGRTSTGEEFAERQVLLPETITYPPDVDWKSINRDLLYQILMLPAKLRSTNRAISYAGEHADFPDFSEYFESRWEGYANLGLEALDLSAELRDKFKLPEIASKDFNPRTFFKDKILEIQRRHEKFAATISELNASLEENSKARS